MGIKEDNFLRVRQFVSMDELFFELTQQEHITEEEVARWLLDTGILDELTLFKRELPTHSLTAIKREKPLTRSNAEKLIIKSASQAQQKIDESFSIKDVKDIKDVDALIKKSRDITQEYIEKIAPILLNFQFFPIEDHDEWHKKFLNYADEYLLNDINDLNIGWQRSELSVFFEKHGILLDPMIKYPTYEERKEYLRLKWLERNQPVKQDLLFEDPSLDVEDLQAENARLKQHIIKLEQQLKQKQLSNEPSNTDLLAYILDRTQDHYAPDLALSIQLYRYVYIDKPSKDSHSNKANLWIKNNTGYNTSSNTSSQSVGRIREITAPFKDWGIKRNKNYIKE